MRTAAALAGLALLALGTSQSAAAAVIASGSGSVTSASPLQNGRITRNGIASSWAVPKAWPGFNDNATRHFESISIGFAPNATQDVYYRLTVTQESTSLFTVSYGGPYNPADQELNYVGDPGASGPNMVWEAIVPTGGTLNLVFLEVLPNSGTLPFSYSVEAFSNAQGGGFGAVPEPASWAMLIAGFGLTGAAMRRRRLAAV